MDFRFPQTMSHQSYTDKAVQTPRLRPNIHSHVIALFQQILYAVGLNQHFLNFLHLKDIAIIDKLTFELSYQYHSTGVYQRTSWYSGLRMHHSIYCKTSHKLEAPVFYTSLVYHRGISTHDVVKMPENRRHVIRALNLYRTLDISIIHAFPNLTMIDAI
jgi:hypothetical protein